MNDLDFQSPVSYGCDPCAKNQRRRSGGSKVRVETSGWARLNLLPSPPWLTRSVTTKWRRRFDIGRLVRTKSPESSTAPNAA